MSEVILEKNRPFRVDLEKTSFLNDAPDNRDNFEKLRKIFNKTLRFTIAEKSELGNFNDNIQTFRRISSDINIGNIKSRKVQGIVKENKLILESNEIFNLSKDHYCVIEVSKKFASRFSEMLEYYEKYKKTKDSVEKNNLGIIKVNIETGKLDIALKKNKFSVYDIKFSDDKIKTIVTDFAKCVYFPMPLLKSEVYLKDISPKDEQFYEETYQIQLFDVEIDLNLILKY